MLIKFNSKFHPVTHLQAVNAVAILHNWIEDADGHNVLRVKVSKKSRYSHSIKGHIAFTVTKLSNDA